MEYRTQFNLRQELKKWEDALLASPSFNEESVQELKNHLLDEIDSLTSNGLSEEEAYFVAQKRLGQTDELTAEYEKVNSVPSKSWLKTLFGGTILMLILISSIKCLSIGLSAVGHLVTPCSGLVFFIASAIIIGLILVIEKKIFDKGSTFLTLVGLSNYTFPLLGIFLITTIMERFIPSSLTSIFQAKQLGHTLLTANVMTFIIIAGLFIILTISFKSQNPNKNLGYV